VHAQGSGGSVRGGGPAARAGFQQHHFQEELPLGTRLSKKVSATKKKSSKGAHDRAQV
jgi:hypothetical protein